MSRILEQSSEYDKIKYSDKVCARCGEHKIPIEMIDICEQSNGTYLCQDCISKEESDKRDEERFQRELDK